MTLQSNIFFRLHYRATMGTDQVPILYEQRVTDYPRRMAAMAQEQHMATATRTRKAPTLGDRIDEMWKLRERKRELEAAVKGIDGQLNDIESELMEKMAEQGVDKMSGTHASISVSTTTVANVEDWDSFLTYIYKNKFGHLLQRRVSDPAYRELLEAGKKVPGVSPFNKQRLNLRARA